MGGREEGRTGEGGKVKGRGREESGRGGRKVMVEENKEGENFLFTYQ